MRSIEVSSTLKLNQYAQAIKLNQPVNIRPTADLATDVHSVLLALNAPISSQASIQVAIHKLHGVLATIDPMTLSESLVARIEAIAANINARKALITSIDIPLLSENYTTNYPEKNITSLWVGDITQLKVDAIVNAANNYLLGCRLPNHVCIDNVIHSAAGPRLRDDCYTIIELQKDLESTGQAKITRGYALPAKYVIHTVGPCLTPGTLPNDNDKTQLVDVYHNCLSLAAEVEDIKTIAFCAISTGVFSYPQDDAAKLALETVAQWLATHNHPFERVIFNLYTENDAKFYEREIYEWT